MNTRLGCASIRAPATLNCASPSTQLLLQSAAPPRQLNLKSNFKIQSAAPLRQLNQIKIPSQFGRPRLRKYAGGSGTTTFQNGRFRDTTRPQSTKPIIPSAFKLHPSNTTPQSIHPCDLNRSPNVAKSCHCLKKHLIQLWAKMSPRGFEPVTLRSLKQMPRPLSSCPDHCLTTGQTAG